MTLYKYCTYVDSYTKINIKTALCVVHYSQQRRRNIHAFYIITTWNGLLYQSYDSVVDRNLHTELCVRGRKKGRKRWKKVLFKKRSREKTDRALIRATIPNRETSVRGSVGRLDRHLRKGRLRKTKATATAATNVC